MTRDQYLYWLYLVKGRPYQKQFDEYVSFLRQTIDSGNLTDATIFLKSIAEGASLSTAKTVKMVILGHYKMSGIKLLWDTERGFYV